MSSEPEIREWVEEKCPTLFSLLNQRARKCLPPGLIDFLSGQWADNGKDLLVAADKRAEQLVRSCGITTVGDAYRRDLSGITGEKGLAELLCEITVCAAVARLSSSPPELRPFNGRDQGRCDFKVELMASELYGEVKRYEDPWPSSASKARSVMKAPSGSSKPGSSRPRHMDLVSKLAGVPDQFPSGTTNVLFVFHPSIGESHRYVQQALFGQSTFWEDRTTILVADGDGLFAKDEWCEVSGCGLLQFQDSVLKCAEFWRNSRAKRAAPQNAVNALTNLLS